MNEFLLHGKGTAKAACKALDMWMYDTVETEKLMLWIRDYNQSRQHNEKIRFYGIDYAMQ
ncbi:MAG: erythromycin esterase family protein, partial [Pedobacter sp.]